MSEYGITLADIVAARRRIAPIITRTPLMRSFVLSERVGTDIYLKLENVQHTGSFKLRGAANTLLSLSEGERARGVIAVSSGNHGRAVSYVSALTGIKATVCLAENVAANKVEGIRRYGAEVVSQGASYDEAELNATRLREERGLTYVSPYDDLRVIAGQGTIGLEILEDLPEIDTVIVPLSGGGLISGVALALKMANPNVRVIGVSMARGAVMAASLKAGHPVELPEEPTLADALVGGLGNNNLYSFDLCRALIDETVLVSEEEIAEAMRFMLETHHHIVEGGAAVGVAAVLNEKVALGKNVAVVVSGANVDIPRLMAVAAGDSS